MTGSPPRFRALLVGIRSPEFVPSRATRRVKHRLLHMFPGGDVQEALGGAECKREPLHRRIRKWVDDAHEGDICVFYYFGHGGRAKFTDLDSEKAAERVVPYLSCETSSPTSFTGILDRELSTWLSELDRKCGNVTVLIDSCYSGTVVRAVENKTGPEASRVVVRGSKTLRTFKHSPWWVKAELDAAPSEALAPESHPSVVRMTGASPRREAHLDDDRNPGIGMFTAELLDVLEAAGDEWAKLSWDMLAHAVRERVISAHGMEGQWISLAGPGERLLFSTDRVAKRLRAVGYRDTRNGHWIRAGALTGVEAGDRWVIANPLVDSHHRHGAVARGTVKTVGLNRAELELADAADCDARQPASGSLRSAAAFLERVQRPMPVFVEASVQPGLELEHTVWLCAGQPHCRNHVRRVEQQLELLDTTGEWARVRVADDAAGREQLVELLEDRARADRLLTSLEALAQQRPPRSPIEWQLGIGGEPVESDTHVRPGGELWVRLHNTAKGGPHWFGSAVLIDVIGRPWLLNASGLDGVELEPDDLEYIGRRPGAVREGVALTWPGGAIIDMPRRVRVLTISSGRPIQLGHLIRVLPVSEMATFRLPDLDHDRHRGPGGSEVHDKIPALSHDWGWAALDLELDVPDTAQG